MIIPDPDDVEYDASEFNDGIPREFTYYITIEKEDLSATRFDSEQVAEIVEWIDSGEEFTVSAEYWKVPECEYSSDFNMYYGEPMGFNNRHIESIFKTDTKQYEELKQFLEDAEDYIDNLEF